MSISRNSWNGYHYAGASQYRNCRRLRFSVTADFVRLTNYYIIIIIIHCSVLLHFLSRAVHFSHNSTFINIIMPLSYFVVGLLCCTYKISEWAEYVNRSSVIRHGNESQCTHLNTDWVTGIVTTYKSEGSI